MHTLLSKRYFGLSKFLTILLCCLMLLGCSRDDPSAPTSMSVNETAVTSDIPDLDLMLEGSVRELVRGYLQQIDLDFNEVESNLELLQNELALFIESPNTGSMDNVRASWLRTHSAFELTSLHRYFAGIVVAEQESLALFQLQYRINHWPILPGYIDYVEGYSDSGIVHDITVVLDVPGLQAQHGVFELAEATLGFHVLEYLVWGENQQQNALRPASDYEPLMQLTAEQIDGGLELAHLSNNRRRQFVVVVSDALLEDFQSSQLLWNQGSIPFRDNLDSMSGSQLLSLLMEAMTTMLTEELLVRSLYPLLNGEYESSIQSPFSNSTQNAISAQLSGVERLLLESKTDSGRTLDSLLVTLSTDFEEFFYQNFDASKECLVLLYSSLEEPQDPATARQAEFEIVECINLLTNMIDNLEQIKIGLSVPI